MHCELLISGLLSPRGSPADDKAAQRLPSLELLLGRGRRSDGDSLSAERWLLQAFGCGDAPLAAGALTLLADSETAVGDGAADASWIRADPIHLRPGADGFLLVPSAAFAISREEAESLAEAINVHFASVLTVYPLRPERWCARLAALAAPQAAAPLELAGRSVNPNLPRGSEAKRWHAILNEIQMLLHDHPVNRAREARGEPALNSIWLWGGGPPPREAKSRWRSVAADDPIALGLARLAGTPRTPLPPGAREWLARLPHEGRELIVLDALRAPLALGDEAAFAGGLQALEALWFAPLLQALRHGRIGMLTVHVPEAGVSFETIRADLRRFWRRSKPLAAYAG
jgi:hypothetical protein